MNLRAGQSLSFKYETLKISSYSWEFPFLFEVRGTYNSSIISFDQNILYLNIKIFTKKDYKLAYTSPYAHHNSDTYTDNLGINYTVNYRNENGESFRIIIDPEIDVHTTGLYWLVPVDRFIPFGDYFDTTTEHYFKKIGFINKLTPNLLDFDSKNFIDKKYDTDSLKITLLYIWYKGKALKELKLTRKIKLEIIQGADISLGVSINEITHSVPIHHFDLKE